MFVAKQAAALPESVTEAGKADGFVHVCDQSGLMFGSDRKIPVKFRPVISIKKDGPRTVVLPCTTKDSSASPEFFELIHDKHVHWVKRWDGHMSFACCRYEVIDPAHLQPKAVGAMPQPARIELLNWLKSRY